MINYDWHAQGLDDITLRIRAVNENLSREIKDIIQDAQAVAEAEWKALIPYRSGKLYRSIEAGPVIYRPGGAGGGGAYEASLSVGGTENTEHLRYVVEGTGLYGPSGSRIFPAKGNVMVFHTDAGEKVFTSWTRGQLARDEWILAGQRLANRRIAEGVRTLGLFE